MAARLARYLAGRLIVRPQQTRPLGDGRTPRIRPDLTFEQPAGEAVYVADTKYKITADGYGRDTDYYQILAYTRALDVPAGMLIYCQRDGDAPPRAITVGTHQTRLDTWALTLSGTPADIEHHLKDLANRTVEGPPSDPRLWLHEPRPDRDGQKIRRRGPLTCKRVSDLCLLTILGQSVARLRQDSVNIPEHGL